MATHPQTKLDRWMGDERDDLWLASIIGCSRSQASRVRRGKSRTSAAGAFAIERATKGKVKAADMFAEPVPANDPLPHSEAA